MSLRLACECRQCGAGGKSVDKTCLSQASTSYQRGGRLQANDRNQELCMGTRESNVNTLYRIRDFAFAFFFFPASGTTSIRSFVNGLAQMTRLANNLDVLQSYPIATFVQRDYVIDLPHIAGIISERVVRYWTSLPLIKFRILVPPFP